MAGSDILSGVPRCPTYRPLGNASLAGAPHCCRCEVICLSNEASLGFWLHSLHSLARIFAQQALCQRYEVFHDMSLIPVTQPKGGGEEEEKKNSEKLWLVRAVKWPVEVFARAAGSSFFFARA